MAGLAVEATIRDRRARVVDGRSFGQQGQGRPGRQRGGPLRDDDDRAIAIARAADLERIGQLRCDVDVLGIEPGLAHHPAGHELRQMRPPADRHVRAPGPEGTGVGRREAVIRAAHDQRPRRATTG
ncbi:hypothetical protein WU86_02890, partial [Corynebacterium xerosis]